MNDTATERRLQREAQEHLLATLIYGAKTPEGWDCVDCAKVEITYQRPSEDEHCGHLIVFVARDLDPWTGARQAALDWLEREFPNAEYISVDDIYSY